MSKHTTDDLLKNSITQFRAILADGQITLDEVPELIKICMNTIEIYNQLSNQSLSSAEKVAMTTDLIHEVLNSVAQDVPISPELKLKIDTSLDWVLPAMFRLVDASKKSGLWSKLKKKLLCCS